MVQEREIVDYGVRGRLKFIMPLGDIRKGKISFQKFIQVISLASNKLAFALHSSK